MKLTTKLIELPSLTADLLNANSLLIDNLFASLWREIGMNTILNKAVRWVPRTVGKNHHS